MKKFKVPPCLNHSLSAGFIVAPVTKAGLKPDTKRQFLSLTATYRYD